MKTISSRQILCRLGWVILMLGWAAHTPLWAQQKLVFKDGTTEKVERFEVNGDRVRFKSLERNEWEEVPLNLVDLDATKKRNEKEAQEQKTGEGKSFDVPTVAEKDAGQKKAAALPEVAPGVKLPDAYGLYAWDGKNLVQLTEAGTRKRSDRKNIIINMVAPAPIMKQKFNIQLDGATSDTQLRTATPVFYVHLPEDRAGQISLFRMMVTKTARVLKEVSHSQITGSDSEKSQEYIFTPSIRLGENVYKVFPTKPLAEGEYCLLEMSPERNTLNTTVWDFAIVK
jgi:hypothetical protein